MSCILQEDNDKIVAVLSFNRERLLHDIENYAYIEGDTIDPADAHARHLIQDIVEDGNIDRVMRVMDLAVAECREMLFSYTNSEVDRPALDNALQEPTTYGIVMRLPKSYSQTTLNLLERQVHEYIVCKVMVDWMSIVAPAKVEAWAAKASAAKTWLQTKTQARAGRVRRSMHPF